MTPEQVIPEIKQAQEEAWKKRIDESLGQQREEGQKAYEIGYAFKEDVPTYGD